jgi:predicted aconitase with swiveling domain
MATCRPVATTLQATVLVGGSAAGKARGTREMLSFWGGYDPNTGMVIDRRHPLCGEVMTGRIFVLPKGKGSSTGSAVLLDALVSGHAPAGIVLNRVDEILALGAVVFEEFFHRKIPVVVLDDKSFDLAVGAEHLTICSDGSIIVNAEGVPPGD